MSARLTAAAITARLQEDAILNGATFQGVVTNRPNRYVTYYLSSPDRESNRLTGPSNVHDYSIVFHSVGTTAEQAQLVDEKVQAQLVDWVPAIAGFNCRRVRVTATTPVAYDADVTPSLYYLASTYGLTIESL